MLIGMTSAWAQKDIGGGEFSLKILLHFKAIVGVNHPFIVPLHLQSLPCCNTIARPLRYIYAPPTDPSFYAVHHTILVMAISCKGQERSPDLGWWNIYQGEGGMSLTESAAHSRVSNSPPLIRTPPYLTFTRYCYYQYCMVSSIQTGGQKGSRILSNNRTMVLHQGGQCRWSGGMKG